MLTSASDCWTTSDCASGLSESSGVSFGSPKLLVCVLLEMFLWQRISLKVSQQVVTSEVFHVPEVKNVEEQVPMTPLISFNIIEHVLISTWAVFLCKVDWCQMNTSTLPFLHAPDHSIHSGNLCSSHFDIFPTADSGSNTNIVKAA